jgi:hypothetical protein
MGSFPAERKEYYSMVKMNKNEDEIATYKIHDLDLFAEKIKECPYGRGRL